jgi:DMSO/TMAO reductase YedYZ molybdopterin-dependent catalytic subunit
MPLTRREMLRMTPLAMTPLLTGRLRGQEPPRAAQAFPGMIVRMEQPRNLETPPAALNADLRTEHFFVRSHFAVPQVDPIAFKLVVEGHVANRLELSLDDLKQLPVVSKANTLECAGNSRVFLTPQARGLQWGNGAVGNAMWRGVPLGAVLERARVKPGAVDVVMAGADSGAITSDPPSPGVIHFDRGIPLAKAKKDETLLAWEMNGEPLAASHGAPLRAIVGGWYGMASVKWLTRIAVTDKPHLGFWQTMDYSYWERKEGGPQVTPVAAIRPKAVITSPALDDVLKAGGEHTITGMAWAGERPVGKVELSADGGKTWQPADLGPKAAFIWTGWRFRWTAPRTPGPVKLVARCTDDQGNTQPETRNPDYRSYIINHLVPVEVLVR